MPSFAACQVDFTPLDGYRAINPSVARRGGDVLLVQRTVNYELTDGFYHTPKDAPIDTRNFLLRLNDELQIESSAEILPPVDFPEPSYQLVRGIEDLRLFVWRDSLWCCGTVRELTPQGWCEQVLARIDDGMPVPEQYRLTDWRLLHPPGPRLHEKNWMPRVAGDRLQFIYRCDPTRIIDDQARTVVEMQPIIAAEQFSGGSQAIVFDDGWLALESPQLQDPKIALNEALSRQEREMIESVLTETGGRVSGPGGAAEKLSIPARTLDSKIKRLRINKFRFKDPKTV